MARSIVEMERNRERKREWYATNREVQSARVARNRDRALAILRAHVWSYLQEHACVDCGETDWLCLEFDHVRGIKRANVSILMNKCVSLRVLKAEIDKCDVRCVKCHRLKSMREAGNWRCTYTPVDPAGEGADLIRR